MPARINICGIDTSTLPKLSHDEQMELMKKARSGDKAARDRFVLANLRLVLSVIQRFYSKKGNADDLFQVGTIGLIKAMDNFDQTLSLKFSTYAVPLIIGIGDAEHVRFGRHGLMESGVKHGDLRNVGAESGRGGLNAL